MKIGFETLKDEGLANDYEKLSRWCSKKGRAAADDILATLEALQAANDLHELPYVLRPHSLKGKLKGCFAVNINKKDRVIFKPDSKQVPEATIYQPKTIKEIVVVELCTDYHEH